MHVHAVCLRKDRKKRKSVFKSLNAKNFFVRQVRKNLRPFLESEKKIAPEKLCQAPKIFVKGLSMHTACMLHLVAALFRTRL